MDTVTFIEHLLCTRRGSMHFKGVQHSLHNNPLRQIQTLPHFAGEETEAREVSKLVQQVTCHTVNKTGIGIQVFWFWNPPHYQNFNHLPQGGMNRRRNSFIMNEINEIGLVMGLRTCYSKTEYIKQKEIEKMVEAGRSETPFSPPVP